MSNGSVSHNKFGLLHGDVWLCFSLVLTTICSFQLVHTYIIVAERALKEADYLGKEVALAADLKPGLIRVSTLKS